LLRELAPEEIIFVTAHEIGHTNDFIYDYRRRTNVVLTELVMCLSIIGGSLAILMFASPMFQKRILVEQSSLLVWLILINLYLLVLPPLDNILSWKAEMFADTFAAQLIITDEASRHVAINMFAHVSRSSPLDPNPPFIIQLMFNDHPSIAERQQNVLNYQIPVTKENDRLSQ
jgi:Zn-dependent protease with chaperone function